MNLQIPTKLALSAMVRDINPSFSRWMSLQSWPVIARWRSALMNQDACCLLVEVGFLLLTVQTLSLSGFHAVVQTSWITSCVTFSPNTDASIDSPCSSVGCCSGGVIHVITFVMWLVSSVFILCALETHSSAGRKKSCLPVAPSSPFCPVFCLFVCFVFVFFWRATLTAYGDSQARGLIRPVAAGLCQSPSNARSQGSIPGLALWVKEPALL